MVKYLVFPDVELYVAPLTETLSIPLLSVQVTAKVTVCEVLLLVRLTEESSTVNDEIDGAWLSVLVTVTLSFNVEELPAASVATQTCVAVVEP